MAQVRPYRGVEAADRARRASAPLAGRRTGHPRCRDPDPAELTVRAHLPPGRRGAAVLLRELHRQGRLRRAVFDWVIADIAATTQAAVASAPPDEQARAGMANIVRDHRRRHPGGPAAVQRRAVQHGDRAQARGVDCAVRGAARSSTPARWARRTMTTSRRHHISWSAASTQTISAWLAGDIRLDHDELVDQLAALIDQLAGPAAADLGAAGTGAGGPPRSSASSACRSR